MKTSKAIFNMDTALKKDVMRKAHKEGMTLSTLLNFIAREYVNGNIRLSVFQRDLAKARDDIKHGKSRPAEEVFRELDL